MDPVEPGQTSPASGQPPPAAPVDDGESEVGGVDLATIGLTVFFVAVIAVVAALLIVQNLT